MRRIFISAAEPSGDVLGAELVRALEALGDVSFFGLAGPQMRAAGVEPIAEMEDVAAMGIAEVLTRLPQILATKATLKAAIAERPAAAIFIDAPDLHHPLGRHARSHGVPSIGYVSPQVWAWRAGRAQTMHEVFDQLLCLFDFEPALFPKAGAAWVGHPVVDRLAVRQSVDPCLFGLAPGSRSQETARMREPFIETARRIRGRLPDARFLLLSPDDPGSLPDWIAHVTDVRALSRARGVLTKSGTITLELAVMGVPQVVAHRVHPLTHRLGRMLVQGIDYIAMPNILAKQPVVPEYIQVLDPEVLSQAILSLPTTQAVDLQALGPGGASKRAAARVWTAMEAS